MNKLRFISPDLHGFLDYSAALGLILLPFIIDLQSQSVFAHWLSVVGGFGLIFYSLLTDYALSIKGLFSFKAHLALDLGAAVVFGLAPFLFGFSGIVMAYYIVMAAGVLIVVALSQHLGATVEQPSSENAVS